MRRLLPLLIAAGGLAACGSEPTSDANSESTQPTTTQPTTTQPATEPATTEPAPVLGQELVGRWAHYDVVAYEDDVLKTLIISYGFNDFTEVDGQIVDQASFCFSEQRTDPNDPRIVDDDGDGKPGLTVTIEVTPELIGELYIARREIFAYEAFLDEPDVLTGVVTDNSEQLVIGASDPIFASSPANWDQYSDLTKSPIILKRVDADWDCARLAAEREVLFPPTPEVDW